MRKKLIHSIKPSESRVLIIPIDISVVIDWIRIQLDTIEAEFNRVYELWLDSRDDPLRNEEQ